MAESKARVYDDLMCRHWDRWDEGEYRHIFIAELTSGGIGKGVDIIGEGAEWDTPDVYKRQTLISTKAYYLLFLVTILAKTFFTLVGRHLVTLMFLSVRHNCNCLKFLLFI